jgi:hypothetical protein
MKVNQKMDESRIQGKAGHSKKRPANRELELVFPSLPSSVNPLFRLAHHTQFYFFSPSASGGQK